MKPTIRRRHRRKQRFALLALLVIGVLLLDGAALLRWPIVAYQQRLGRTYAVTDMWPHARLWPSPRGSGPELCVFSLDWVAAADARRDDQLLRVAILAHVQDGGGSFPASAYGHSLTAVGAEAMVRDLMCSVDESAEWRRVTLRDLSTALFPPEGGTHAVIGGRAFQLVLECPIHATDAIHRSGIQRIVLRGPSRGAPLLRLEQQVDPTVQGGRGGSAVWGIASPPPPLKEVPEWQQTRKRRRSLCLNSPLRSVSPFRVLGSIKEHGAPLPPSRAMVKLLRTWIEYHLLLGFDTVHLYERHGAAQFTFAPFVEDLVRSGGVTMTEWPPFVANIDQVLRDYDQVHINTHCVLSHAHSDEWLLALDLDEFLRIRQPRPESADSANVVVVQRGGSSTFGDDDDGAPAEAEAEAASRILTSAGATSSSKIARAASDTLDEWLLALSPHVDLVLPRRVPFSAATLRTAEGALVFEEQLLRPALVSTTWNDAALPKWMVRPFAALAAHNHAVYLDSTGGPAAAAAATATGRVVRPSLEELAVYHYGKQQDLRRDVPLVHDDSLRFAVPRVRERVERFLAEHFVAERAVDDDGLRWRGRN